MMEVRVIVCVCANVNHRSIEKAIDEGCQTLEQLQMETGACTGCGQCRQLCEGHLKKGLSAVSSVVMPTGLQSIHVITS